MKDSFLNVEGQLTERQASDRDLRLEAMKLALQLRSNPVAFSPEKAEQQEKKLISLARSIFQFLVSETRVGTETVDVVAGEPWVNGAPFPPESVESMKAKIADFHQSQIAKFDSETRLQYLGRPPFGTDPTAPGTIAREIKAIEKLMNHLEIPLSTDNATAVA